MLCKSKLNELPENLSIDRYDRLKLCFVPLLNFKFLKHCQAEWVKSEPALNPILSTNSILNLMVLQSPISFDIGNEKIIYFAVFSSRQSNCPSNSSINLLMKLMMKW